MTDEAGRRDSARGRAPDAGAGSRSGNTTNAANANAAADNADALREASATNEARVGATTGTSAGSSGGGEGAGIRRPRPEAAATDARDAAVQDQVRRDSAASREQAARVEASTPPEVRDRTVHEIVTDAERNADRR